MISFSAVLTAFVFALSDISLRNALRFASPVAASLVTVAIQWLIYTAILLATGMFSTLHLTGLLWFALAGIVNPILFLTFYLLAIQRIGVARSSPIKGSAPIFAVGFAVAVLGERLAPLQYAGIALVVAGIISLSAEGAGAGGGAADRPVAPGRPSGLGAGAAFALLAGLSAGIASNLFKIGLGRLPSPLLGAWVGASEGLLLFPLVAFLFPKNERFRLSAPAWPWLLAAGATATAAVYGLFFSIGLGRISIVFPLVQTSPLF
ncbi:MAG: EamA family transporter, partial [Nitrospinota bacterium]